MFELEIFVESPTLVLIVFENLDQVLLVWVYLHGLGKISDVLIGPGLTSDYQRSQHFFYRNFFDFVG
jgi:hypothetical protein